MQKIDAGLTVPDRSSVTFKARMTVERRNTVFDGPYTAFGLDVMPDMNGGIYHISLVEPGELSDSLAKLLRELTTPTGLHQYVKVTLEVADAD
jgi:hypothetical protein